MHQLALCGDVVDCKNGPLFVNHHAWIENLLIKQSAHLTKRGTYYHLMYDMLGAGLLTEDTEAWNQLRCKHQSAFLSTQIKTLTTPLEQHCHMLTAEIQNADTHNLSETISILSVRLFHQALLGTDCPEEARELFQLIQVCNEETSKISHFHRPIKQRPRSKKTLARLHLILLKAAQKAKPQGILYPLAMQYQQNKITHQQFLAEMKNFFIAGTETTSNSLIWLITLLLNHPHYHDQVIAESGQDDSPIRSQCIAEALRLYPPIWCLLRRSQSQIDVGNYTIQANRPLIFCPYWLHRSEHYWPKPDQFNPSRFSKEQIQLRPKNAYIPFGIGPRICIGKQLALMVMEIICRELLQQLTLQSEKIIDTKARPLVTLQKNSDLIVSVTRR